MGRVCVVVVLRQQKDSTCRINKVLCTVDRALGVGVGYEWS
jgi:hypothetical protein